MLGAGLVVLAADYGSILEVEDDECGSVSSRQTVFFPEREPRGLHPLYARAAPVFLPNVFEIFPGLGAITELGKIGWSCGPGKC